MARQLDLNLTLSVLGSLKRKTSGRQRVHELYSHHSAVSSVTNPPNSCKVSLLQVTAGSDFVSVNIRRAKCISDKLRRCTDARCGQLALPRIKMLQLLHVDRNIIDIFAKVRICRNTGSVDTSCSGGDDVFIGGLSRSLGVKILQKNTRIKLKG